MADSNPFDQAARYLARADAAGVLGWVLGDPAGQFHFRRWIDTRTLPFPGSPERVGDLVAHLERVDPPGQPWLVPIEFQIAPDPLMFGRLLEYLGRLWQAEKPATERGDRFWLGAAVVNLTGTGRASSDFEWSPTGPRTCLRVSERNAARESAGRTLAGIAAGWMPRAVLSLVPLMEGGDEPGIIEEWQRLAAVEPDSRRRSDCGALALIFAEAAGRRRVWSEALKGWNMTESQQVLDWQAEALARGRAEGQAAAVVAALEARFQSVPADLVAAITSLTDFKRLSTLIPIAVKAPSLDQFRADAGL